MGCKLMIAGVLTVTASFAQDVTKLMPDRAKVVFENDRVRVVRFTEPAHTKLPMHSHPAYVAVGFTDDQFKYNFPDGKTSEQKTKAGEAAYEKAVTHAAENVGSTTSEGVLVELKSKPGAAATKPAIDAVKADPKHYQVEFENDQVRILRIRYGPHEKSVMHEHPAGVAIPMTDAKAKMTSADGSSQTLDMKAREAQWSDAQKHLPENVGDKPFELVLVELKK